MVTRDDFIQILVTAAIVSSVFIGTSIALGIWYARKVGLTGSRSRHGVDNIYGRGRSAETEASSGAQRGSADSQSGLLAFLKRHRKLTVAAVFVLASLMAWWANLQVELEDPLFNGAAAQALAGFVIFLVVNEYAVCLYSVPLVRKQRGYDMSYHMALAYAGAAPLLGMVATVPTELDWPLWACIALGLVGSIGPLSVIDMTDRFR